MVYNIVNIRGYSEYNKCTTLVYTTDNLVVWRLEKGENYDN